MRTLLKKDTGAIAIEAVLGMFIFAVAILAIMFMSLMVRVQSTMQYALGQTAKEISGYCYVIDKLGLAFGTSTNDDSVKKANDVIGTAIEFSSEADDVLGSIDFSNGVSFDDVKNIAESDMPKLAKDLYGDVEALSGDLKGQLKGTLVILMKSMLKEGMSNYVAPYVCKTVMPKYISGDVDSTNEMLEAMGIEGGLDKLDFSKSSLLSDGRTIQIVVVYKLNTKKLTLGMVDQDLYFKQVATTAAWVQPDGRTLISVAETVNK